jgi:hypothetical protein
MKKSKKEISYNKELKLWELRSQNHSKEFVKTKKQAMAWLKNKLGNGDCYEVSGKLILDWKLGNSDSCPLLCHGIVHGQGPLKGAIFGHGWVEYNQTLPTTTNKHAHTIQIALDKSNGKELEIPVPVYYLIGKIDPEEVKKYNKEEIRENILKHGHWGPWET